MTDASITNLEDDALLADQPDDDNLVKTLRKAARDAKREAADLRKQTAEITAKQRESEVTAALTAKGVDARAARFALKDGVDATKLDEWLKENGDVFGFKPTTAAPSEPAPEHVESAAALARINTSVASASVPTSGDETVQKMNAATDLDSFKDFLRSQGATV